MALCGCGRGWPRGRGRGGGRAGRGSAPQRRRAWNTDPLVFSINYFCKKTKCSGAWLAPPHPTARASLFMYVGRARAAAASRRGAGCAMEKDIKLLASIPTQRADAHSTTPPLSGSLCQQTALWSLHHTTLATSRVSTPPAHEQRLGLHLKPLNRKACESLLERLGVPLVALVPNRRPIAKPRGARQARAEAGAGAHWRRRMPTSAPTATPAVATASIVSGLDAGASGCGCGGGGGLILPAMPLGLALRALR